ncbi:hypothetical protein ACTXT7_011220 [Hymenolepis weldensis]
MILKSISYSIASEVKLLPNVMPVGHYAVNCTPYGNMDNSILFQRSNKASLLISRLHYLFLLNTTLSPHLTSQIPEYLSGLYFNIGLEYKER